MLMWVEVLYLLTTCIYVIFISLETAVNSVKKDLKRRGNIFLVQ